MKDGRFEIGDIVIGTEEANDHYSITNKGWVGKVVRFVGDCEDYNPKTSHPTIILRGLDDSEDFSGYDVCHRYFKLYSKQPPYLKITGQTMPGCCGECFALDAIGCKFNATVLSDKVWKCRAENCPISYHAE